jgi:Family of unknown function (DUF6959)
MEHEHAHVLSRAGNWAVVHLPGRQFPGIQLQGDTFAMLRTNLVEAARSLRSDPADPEALDGLDYAIREMDVMLAFYEQVLADQGIKRPY